MKLYTLLISILFVNAMYSQGNGLHKFADNKTNLYGFMDETGKIIIKPQFLITDDFSEGLCFVSKDIMQRGYHWIFIDTLGNTIIDLHNDFADTGFSQGYARVSSLDKTWFIDKSGNKMFGRTFADGLGTFSEGFALVNDVQFEDFYYINLKGEKVDYLPARGRIFSKGLAAFYKEETGHGVTDTLGNIIISGLENVYHYHETSDDYLKVKKNGKWGFIDRSGKLIFDFTNNEDDIYYGNDNLFLIKENGLWGVKNINGETIIKPLFKNIRPFAEDLAAATLDGKRWGFIDKSGAFAIKPKYFDADSFENGVCGVKTVYEQFKYANDYAVDAIIDKEGKILNQIDMHC
jgi:hypothetical protein